MNYGIKLNIRWNFIFSLLARNLGELCYETKKSIFVHVLDDVPRKDKHEEK